MALVVPAGIIVASQDTAPYGAGWSRVLELDGRFPRGAAVAGGTGGAETHNHTSSHTHVASGPHAHNGGLRPTTPSGITHHWVEPMAWYPANVSHGHTMGVTVGPTTSVLIPGPLSLDADDHLPLYRNWTWLKSDGVATLSADEALFWLDIEANLPFGWTRLVLNERYLRGTPDGGAVGAEGGATQAATHTHADAGHVHGWDAHNHTVSGSGTSGPYGGGTPIVTVGLGMTVMGLNHTHTYNITGCIAASEANTDSTACNLSATAAGNPECLCVHIVEGSLATDFAPGILALWDGETEDIPRGWRPCDGSAGPDYQGLLLKGATDLNVGTIEGTADPSHTHTANSHTHTQSGTHEHDLTGTCGNGGPTTTCLAGPSPPSRMDTHTHDLYLTGSKTASMSNTTPTLGTTGTMPPCYDVIIIQYHEPSGSVLLRPRPADLWRVGIDSDGVLALDDIHADGVIDNYTPYLGALSESPSIWDVSATWFTGSILVAVIEYPPPGQAHTGFLTKTEWIPAGDIPVIGDGFVFVELDMMPAGSMAVALMLYNDAGTYRWYQACGLWDAVAVDFDWTAVPIECETAAVDFPDAGYSKGSLRRGEDASLLFAFQNAAGESVLYRCAAMPSDATGTWEAV